MTIVVFVIELVTNSIESHFFEKHPCLSPVRHVHHTDIVTDQEADDT